MSRTIYLIGSLRNPAIPEVAKAVRAAGHEVFDDWYAAGPEADDKWQEYETTRGRTYKEALSGYAARNVYMFDKCHLDRCDSAVLILPAGKSGHMEFGRMIGQGKFGAVLFDRVPERWDVMYQIASWDDQGRPAVCFSVAELIEVLGKPIPREFGPGPQFDPGPPPYLPLQEGRNARV